MIGILTILVNNIIFGFTFTFSCFVNQISYLQQKNEDLRVCTKHYTCKIPFDHCFNSA
jgi:hypothetical protein